MCVCVTLCVRVLLPGVCVCVFYSVCVCVLLCACECVELQTLLTSLGMWAFHPVTVCVCACVYVCVCVCGVYLSTLCLLHGVCGLSTLLALPSLWFLLVVLLYTFENFFVGW